MSDGDMRDLEAQLEAEFPTEGMRLDINTLRFQLANRTKERDHARDIAASLEAELAELRDWMERRRTILEDMAMRDLERSDQGAYREGMSAVDAYRDALEHTAYTAYMAGEL